MTAEQALAAAGVLNDISEQLQSQQIDGLVIAVDHDRRVLTLTHGCVRGFDFSVEEREAGSILLVLDLIPYPHTYHRDEILHLVRDSAVTGRVEVGQRLIRISWPIADGGLSRLTREACRAASMWMRRFSSL